MPDREEAPSQPSSDAEQSAMDRYLEHREQMLRYDQEYLERLKASQPAPPPAPAAPDVAWGHPICDACPKRLGCGLQQAMKRVDGGAAAPELAANIDADDARCVLAFGTKPQNALASAAKTIVGTSTASASGAAEATLTELLETLREAGTRTAPGAVEKFVRKVPAIGRRFSEARRIIGAYEPIANEITEIEAKLHRQQMTLLTDYESLGEMYAANADFIEQLDVYVAAGQLKLDGLRRQLQDAQATDDCRRAIDRLSQRVYDLELTRMIALQTGPQIRLIQDGDERLAAKIHTAVLTTIPLWKAQIAMAVSLAHQRKAAENVGDVTDTTNELLRSNSETLKQGVREVRTATERSAVDIGTLQAATDDLITSIEDALRISAEGRAKRAAGEKQIAETEERIKSMLAEKQREIEAS